MRLIIFALLVYWISKTECQLTLFPENKQLLYRWETVVTTGGVLPISLISYWSFNASIIIEQIDSNLTFFQIQNIETDHEKLNISSLELPFYGKFSQGLLYGIDVSNKDELWSINMKRALLNVFQLKLEAALFPPAMNAEEVGLFGKCDVEYSKESLGSGLLLLRKNIDLESCSNFPVAHTSNCPLLMCATSFQKLMSSDSAREYWLSPRDEILIQNVTANGRILVQPYQSQAEAHYSKISQQIKFISKQISNRSNTIEGYDSVGINYVHQELDPTYGKEPNNRSALVQEIYGLLEELSDSLSTWEVGVKGLDNQTSFHILDLMWWLRPEDWEMLYKEVTLGTSYEQETIQHLFWDLVPQAGSQATVHFIKSLVITSRLKEFFTSRIIVNFPFYLKETSEELLMECEVFLKLPDNTPPEIKQSAVLSFASLIHKTCKVGCKADTLDRYAKLYLDKFTGSSTYEDKMLYLQGLSNIELGQVLDFLTPVISGEAETDKNIRFLAVWASINSVYTNSDKLYDVYWPIFINRKEPLELRSVALTLLIMSKPKMSRFMSLYWYMQGEPSEQLYNFYFTTIHSLAKTNYPCYSKLANMASKLSRFVPAKSRHWATGNYMLDYEDTDRANGGLAQILLIASEQTGLPNVFMFSVEQHSLGHSRLYTLYLKVNGLVVELCNEFDKLAKLPKSENKISKVMEILQKMNVTVQKPEDVHLELIFKIDGRTIFSQYMNKTSFTNMTKVVKKMSSIVMEFSVNHQSLHFPLLISTTAPSDLGVPALSQIRSASLISTRGKIIQEEEGRRNAELDIRFSWNGVTTLKVYNPLSNRWHGADRCRNLHIRLPFATQLILEMAKPIFKVTAVRHKDFVTGSRLGLVWHASTRLVTKKPILKMFPNISDEWTMDSEDLGARLGASVFDCPHPDTLPDALQGLKKAFLANHKNYNMVPGGVVLLGLLSMKDQLHFQPQGSSCGVMLYFTPLLTQVEPVLASEGNSMRLSMTRQDGLLWEIQAGSKRLNDGNKEFTFKLYRAPSVSVTVAHIWRVIQLEGAFIVPSRMAGVFHPPAALTGYAFVSWGDAAPSQADKAAMLDLKVMPGHNDTGSVMYCEGFTPGCLQAGSDLATRQTAILQYANLPIWLKMAAHALFPEHIQTEGTHTQVTFDYPVALLPWNTKGLCALDSGTVLTLDNATLTTTLNDCYALALADCSQGNLFSIEVRKLDHLMGARVFAGTNEVILTPQTNKSMEVNINGVKIENIGLDYVHHVDNVTQLNLRRKNSGIFEVELRSGVVLQHYNKTVVVLVPAIFRGYTCGLCGNFNGDTNNEPSILYTNCDET